MKRFLLPIFLVLAFACDKIEIEKYAITCVTGDAGDITRNSAVLDASFSVKSLLEGSEDAEAPEIKTWFLIGLDKAHTDTLYAQSADEQTFTATAQWLDYGTQYFYAAGVTVEGKSVTGEFKSFTTRVMIIQPETLEATDIDFFSATMCGKWASTTGDISNLRIFIKFLYGADMPTQEELVEKGSRISARANMDPNNPMYVSYPFPYNEVVGSEEEGYTTRSVQLEKATTYYYMFCIRTEERSENEADYHVTEYYGNICSFTTLGVSYDANAVDLGLSVKWADVNLGAPDPTHHGAYVCWGEDDIADGKRPYKWYDYEAGGYPWEHCLKYNCVEGFGVVDNLMELEPEDDIARIKMGGAWRMPTVAEASELISSCAWQWTMVNDVPGYRISSKTNGNSIFIPANGGGLSPENAEEGMYWTTGNYRSKSHLARMFHFDKAGEWNWVGFENKNYALGIRAVCP